MKNIIAFFFFSYFISWLIWAPLFLPRFGFYGLPVLPYHHYIGSFGPLVAAFIVQYATRGKKGARDLLRRMVKWKVNITWYFIVVAGCMLVFLTAAMLAKLINGAPVVFEGFGTNKEFPGLPVAGYFLLNLFSFGFGEETGWRGFALPALQTKMKALKAATLLTFGWAAWHLPAFLYRPIYSHMGAAGVIGFFLSLYTGSILLTWLFNSTNGSILLVALFHAMIEVIFMSDNITSQISAYEGIIITIAAIAVVVFAKPANLSHLYRQVIPVT